MPTHEMSVVVTEISSTLAHTPESGSFGRSRMNRPTSIAGSFYSLHLYWTAVVPARL